MKSIDPKDLLIAFPAFDETGINSSEAVAREVLRRIPETVHLEICPNNFGEAPDWVSNVLDGNWASVVATGQAGMSTCLALERFAHNYVDAGERSDASGFLPRPGKITAEQAEALSTNVDIEAITSELRGIGLPVTQSLSAGSHLCNYLYFQILSQQLQRGMTTPTIFVHIPRLTEQLGSAVAWEPSVSKPIAAQAICSIFEALDFRQGEGPLPLPPRIESDDPEIGFLRT